MTKEQKDLAWASLSKKARSSIKRAYFYPALNEDYNRGFNEAIEEILGKDNLTSDTEPEEMLMMERRKVQKLYESIHDDYLAADESLPYFLAQTAESLLKTLFDDKCLPDKEEPKPKYSKGDKVIALFGSLKITATIIGIDDYGEYAIIDDKGNKLYHYKSTELEPYTKETMEEKEFGKEDNFPTKELNLCELLKGCEGDWFYVVPCGEMELKGTRGIGLKPLHFSRDTINCLTKADGRAYEDGCCIIYPSRTLYEKYPLDPAKAWDEWVSERMPKRWRAKSSSPAAREDINANPEDYAYWYITSDGVIAQDEETNCKADNLRYNIGNYFRTEEEAQQAAEAVRETLAKLYEQKPT
ncbi:MAG: hypothetical protein HDT08_04215 [Bacteroidales bacterium]|nr:hypothetical protein [Bacteroidales bacterium]